MFANLDEVCAAITSKIAGDAAALIMEGVSRYTPIEDGHAHEAWAAAAKEANVAFPVVPGMSGDERAIAAGRGSQSHTEDESRHTMTNSLGFVLTIEHGGEITANVGGNKGPKLSKHKRPPAGPLYGPRHTKGRGMIAWNENGKVRTGFSYTIPQANVGPVGRAVEEAAAELRRAY